VDLGEEDEDEDEELGMSPGQGGHTS